MAIRAPASDPLGPILAALDAEQRAAATLPDGPAQIIAPAGSGKTTTMVARIAVLIARGIAPDRICVVTFNRDAAQDLARRLRHRLANGIPEAASVEVRTLHALARQVLLDAGEGGIVVADRLPLLRAARRRVLVTAPEAAVSDPASLDTMLSRWKIEGHPPTGPDRLALDAYADLLKLRGSVDFDDLVVRAGALVETNPAIRIRWQARFSHVCVDEFQDVDAAQLRLVRLLASPEDNLFAVGDDDQTIYAWRLADVRRILRFSQDYPNARRVTLATNYRCPVAVVEASARMVAVNVERFAKPIRTPDAIARTPAITASDSSRADWADAMARLAARHDATDRSLCFLSRTRSELVPILLGLVRAGVRHASAVPLVADSDSVRELIEEARASSVDGHPFHVLRGLRARRGWERGSPSGDLLTDDEHAGLDALLGWTVGFRTTSAFLAAFDAATERLAALRVAEAPVELATVHGSKGREWGTVVVIGFEEGRMPNARSISDHADPHRALEEERRLAYVALTRATERLILAFDPRRPSLFLAEMGIRLAR